ncbi:thioredoxin [Acidiferrobacter sp.]|uniref:thioredoxin n=1 Tax=Acidiferrobacter sp. TaxID=1872107 RepID=UPI002632653B|nr:thioredoxin [Acidiferrobacter sp.]
MATSPYMIDVTGDSFDHAVLARSREVPVLVDFWAAWCAPCRSLMPILAKLAEEYQGRFFLAKVNSDEQQDLAARFGVRSLPTVKLFKQGAEVAQFVGAQPERMIRELLDAHIDRPSDALLRAALDQEATGDRDGALARLKGAHETDPKNDRLTAHLGRLLCEQGRVTDSEAILKGLSPRALGDAEIGAIMARLEFVRMTADAPPLTDLEQTIRAHPEDLRARMALGARYLLAGRHEEALEQWLTIVRTDRRFGDDAARRALLAAFTLLGGKSDLVRRYRGLLAAAIT